MATTTEQRTQDDAAGDTGRQVTYLDALRETLRSAMAADDKVCLLGEDIGRYGGAFKVTAGLVDEFGTARVRDTPIAEAGFTGAAIGMALAGYKPVVELQFADFISCAFDQLVTVAAKMRYRVGRGVGIVVRGPSGGGFNGGPYHSQNPEAWFCRVPGLKVVCPATAEDAGALLRAAIDDPDPVIFFEHKHLYRRIKGTLTTEAGELGRAAVRREGSDLTIVTYSSGLHWSLAAAEALADVGSVEVVDLRTVWPIDWETVYASVEKTGKLICVSEDYGAMSVSSEVAARVARDRFDALDAPIGRVSARFTPSPFSPTLEPAHLPTQDQVTAAVRDLLEY